MIITRVIPRRQMEIVSEYDFDRVGFVVSVLFCPWHH